VSAPPQDSVPSRAFWSPRSQIPPPPLFLAKGDPRQKGRPGLGPPPPWGGRTIKRWTTIAQPSPAPSSARGQDAIARRRQPGRRVPRSTARALHSSPVQPAGSLPWDSAPPGDTEAEQRRCRPQTHQGVGRANTMLAPRGAAFLLLHLALQPWLGAGAQATPQGKWDPAGAWRRAPGPFSVKPPAHAAWPSAPGASPSTSLFLWGLEQIIL
jgi:hypothetical protein